MPKPPISSKQWLARIGLLLVIAASEVALPASLGASTRQVLVLGCASVLVAISYLLTASPGKVDYERASFRPVLAMRLGATAAVAVTGGLLSPLLPLIAVPMAMSWTMIRPKWRDAGTGLATLAILAIPLHPAFASHPFSAAGVAVLAGWSTIVAGWAISRRVAELHHVQRCQAMSLARIRESALADVESRRQGIGSMTTKLAHEIKNPLAAIKSLVQLEACQATDDKTRRRLGVVLTEIERLGSILGGYLDVSRPVVEARLGRVDLGDLMNDVSTLVTGRAEAAGVELTVSGNGGSFQGDIQLLKEAMVNVVCNAIEATPHGGHVAVSYEVGKASLLIAIADTGEGMTKEVATRIGTPYFTTRERGIGLGVVIAKSAITQHGGTLAYESTAGAGTVAKIELPIASKTQQRVVADEDLGRGR